MALRHRIRWLTGIFVFGLVLSGLTAIPLQAEASWLTQYTNTEWLMRVHDALIQTQAHYPFLFYGTDWLAFGHFVIGIAFLGR
ncbi:MAG TPA: hypothetical protein VGY56_12965 [Verrucomicrobiae bacterium]|nr:hypothetical protein [Verrucomicrobiae bacterium]